MSYELVRKESSTWFGLESDSVSVSLRVVGKKSFLIKESLVADRAKTSYFSNKINNDLFFTNLPQGLRV